MLFYNSLALHGENESIFAVRITPNDILKNRMNYLLVPKNNFHLIPSVDKTVTFPIPKAPRADSTNTTVHSEARCVPLKYNKHQLVLLYLSASYFNNAEHSKDFFSLTVKNAK